MFHPLTLFVGLRYTRAKKENGFVSFISFTSMLGIALGVTALITVLSVMNGAVSEVRQRILEMSAHVTLTGSYGAPLPEWPEFRDYVLTLDHITAAAPYIQKEVMLTSSGQVSVAILLGVDAKLESGVSAVASKMVEGHLISLSAGSFHVVLGQALADILGVQVGDKITMVAPQATVTPAGIMPRIKRFTISGLFDSGMYDYDRSLAMIALEDAATLFRMDQGVTGLRIRLDNPFLAPRVARHIADQFPTGSVSARNWTQEHANFFRAVQIEKTAMFVILTLIVAVAAFNIVSALVMVVNDKRSDIAILRTMGFTPFQVMMVFVVQGMTVGIIGGLVGLAGGVVLTLNLDVVIPWIERLAGSKFMSPDVYMISELPSQLLVSDVARVAVLALVLAVVATLYPAWRASRIQPAEALRYE